MSMIEKEIEIAGDKGSVQVKALFDAGSSRSLMRRDKAEQIATVVNLPSPLRFELGDGRLLEAKHVAAVTLRIKGCDLGDDVIVVDSIPDECIIGVKTMQAWGIKLDIENEDVLIDETKVKRLRL